MRSFPISRAVIVCLALGGVVVVACAASPAPTQADVDAATLVQKLEEAKAATAKAKQQTAEAQAAEATANLGTLDASKFKPPSGAAKTLNIEGSLLTYKALDRVASRIAVQVSQAASVASSLDKPIVLLGDKETNALRQAKSFKTSLALLSNVMGKFKVPTLAADDPQCKEPDKAGAALPPLMAIDAALQIAQLFKVDKSLEGASVTIDDFALASAVMAKLSSQKFTKIYYGPAYAAGDFGGTDPYGASGIVKSLDDISNRATDIDKNLAEVARRRDKLQAREDDKKVKLSDACKAAFDEARAIYTSLEVRGKALKDRADKFSTAATTVDDKTGVTALQALVLGEAMSKNLDGATILRLSPIAGGGTTYIKTSLFATHIGIGGGAIVAFMLVSGSDGSVLSSGTASDYGGFVEPEGLGALLNPK